MKKNDKLILKQWNEQDRPREKMLSKGRQALSDAELIAILISSGNKEETAVELSRRILNSVDNDLNQLGKLSVNDLLKFKGIGDAKAISIVASLELGRRRKEIDIREKVKITSSRTAFEVMKDVFIDLEHEEFWVLYLNRSNQIIKKLIISKGGVTGTVADVKIILKQAIELLASSIILSHNHPSGNLTPSNQDISLTNKIKEAAKSIDVVLLDHLIITDIGYYSFADEDKLT